jgi:membrane-anchored protein YejM (alkaline phosphatase superfamily)
MNSKWDDYTQDAIVYNTVGYSMASGTFENTFSSGGTHTIELFGLFYSLYSYGVFDLKQSFTIK